MKRIKKILALLLIVSLGFGTCDFTAYATGTKVEGALIDEGNTWNGVDRQSVYDGNDFKATFTLTGYWKDGYKATVRIENTGMNQIENWCLSYDRKYLTSDMWNAEIYCAEKNVSIIKNAGYNKDIAVGESVEFGFVGKGDFPGFPTEYQMLGANVETENTAYSVEYHLNGDWGSGFTGSISIKNNSDTVLEDWVLEFDFDRTITSIWNGTITSQEDNHYIIKNSGYNSSILPGQTISFGFTGKNGEKVDTSYNYKLSSYDMWANVNVGITVDTEKFAYNEYGDWYVVDEKLDTMYGILTGSQYVKSLSYEVRDINDKIVKRDTILIEENWEAENFGLVVGFNNLTVIAETYYGKVYESQINFMNSQLENMQGTEVNLSDTDGDGINNYYESIFGTDEVTMDTDGDGLSDFEEMTKTGTDPLKNDTDENGVGDEKEDLDEDGLNNISEIQYRTNCIIKDTDGDGLTDGDEINKHNTNPVEFDSDCDGLNDGEDVELQFNPTNPDTDGDGILDGDEILFQTCVEEIDTTKKDGVTEVSVSLECSGYIDNRVTIINTYDLDMRSSEVVGLVGVPVDISTDVEFTTANIIFSYDEDALGEAKEENLSVMWYDEENDNYVLLDTESIIDTENNTVSYETEHFSTYLLVDKQIWFDTMRQNLNYRSEEVVHYDLALAVDVSLSMKTDNCFPNAKTALNAFIEGMIEGDYAGLIKFNKTATVVQELTDDKELLKEGVDSLSLKYGNLASEGIRAGIDMLNASTSGNEKILILICDGDVDYYGDLVEEAKANGIRIFCINVMNGSASEMERIALDTGGLYYYAATSEDIAEAISQLKGDTVEFVDATDTDGDGLYDVYEVNGMRLSNGQIVYTDPDNPDTDGDGVSDYDAMGGEPVIETYMINGNIYSCTLNHSVIYGKLSSEFIYVDGTLNSDGKQYFGKMDYVPYSENFLYNKYKKEFVYIFGEESRIVYGDAGIYNSFGDKLATINEGKLLEYAAIGTYTVMVISLLDFQAASCLYRYIQGTGGSDKGLVEGSTREYIYATPTLGKNIFGINSANIHFLENMNKARLVAESILNEYTTETYVSLSPKTTWCGCDYNDCTFSDWRQNIDSLLNIGAFGIYNNADAAITMHCLYNPDTKEYSMEFIYYIIDLYDFTLYNTLDEMNALGLARCYELYGVSEGFATWKEDDSRNSYWMY